MTRGQSPRFSSDLCLDRLEAERVTELSAREVLTPVDTLLGDSAMSLANTSQTAPIDQQSATSNPMFSQGTASVTDAAQTASTQQNAATAQNVLSPGSTSYASQTQYAPSTTSP
jgi:hypothetical protein